MVSIQGLKLSPSARWLDSEPLSSQVYSVLRNAISSGDIAERQHLVQNELAAMLEVSRTPVRDALLRLSQEGLVRAVGARGFVVEALTPHDILEVYGVRMLLEEPAAVAALPYLAAAHIAELELINEQLAQAPDDGNEAYRLNREFHNVLVKQTPNKLVHRMLVELWDLPIGRRIFLHHRGKGLDGEAMAEGHRSILEAAKTGDAELLRVAVHKHLDEAWHEASAWVDEEAGEWN